MARKHHHLTILAMVLLVFLFSGCDPAITPDPSIVWSDDFEDGDIEGWDDLNPAGVISVVDGVLTIGPKRAGDMQHPSDVSTGTWSFDAFLTDDLAYTYQIAFTIDTGYWSGLGIDITKLQNTTISIITVEKGIKSILEPVDTGRMLTGWHHLDVTRDEDGNSKIFLDGDLILEYKDELSISPHWFYFATSIIGPAIDNIVIRNRVIDIQPPE